MRRTKKVPDWDKIRLEVAIQIYALLAQDLPYTAPSPIDDRIRKDGIFERSMKSADAFVDRLKRKYAKENQ